MIDDADRIKRVKQIKQAISYLEDAIDDLEVVEYAKTLLLSDLPKEEQRALLCDLANKLNLENPSIRNSFTHRFCFERSNEATYAIVGGNKVARMWIETVEFAGGQRRDCVIFTAYIKHPSFWSSGTFGWLSDAQALFTDLHGYTKQCIAKDEIFGNYSIKFHHNLVPHYPE